MYENRVFEPGPGRRGTGKGGAGGSAHHNLAHALLADPEAAQCRLGGQPAAIVRRPAAVVPAELLAQVRLCLAVLPWLIQIVDGLPSRIRYSN